MSIEPALWRALELDEADPPVVAIVGGGGKTSLMRMIQEEIDPKGVEKAKAQANAQAREPTRRKLTLGRALREIRKWIKGKTPPLAPKLEEKRRLTVWLRKARWSRGLW